MDRGVCTLHARVAIAPWKVAWNSWSIVCNHPIGAIVTMLDQFHPIQHVSVAREGERDITVTVCNCVTKNGGIHIEMLVTAPGAASNYRATYCARPPRSWGFGYEEAHSQVYTICHATHSASVHKVHARNVWSTCWIRSLVYIALINCRMASIY